MGVAPLSTNLRSKRLSRRWRLAIAVLSAFLVLTGLAGLRIWIWISSFPKRSTSDSRVVLTADFARTFFVVYDTGFIEMKLKLQNVSDDRVVLPRTASISDGATTWLADAEGKPIGKMQFNIITHFRSDDMVLETNAGTTANLVAPSMKGTSAGCGMFFCYATLTGRIRNSDDTVTDFSCRTDAVPIFRIWNATDRR